MKQVCILKAKEDKIESCWDLKIVQKKKKKKSDIFSHFDFYFFFFIEIFFIKYRTKDGRILKINYIILRKSIKNVQKSFVCSP